MEKLDIEKLATQADCLKEECLIPARPFLRGCSEKDHQKMCEEFRYTTYPLSWFDDETPEQKLLLPEFYIDKYLVTNARFARFVAETNYQTSAVSRPHFSRHQV